MADKIANQLQDVVGLDTEAATRVASAIVRALAEQLPARDRPRLLEKLPGRVTAAHSAAAEPVETLAAFFDRVGVLAGLSGARAVEATQIGCAAMVELLGPDTCDWIAARLAAPLTALLSSRKTAPRAPESPHGERRYPTLAEGRPGSTHPLSEAHPDRAQPDSVARSNNPHADTKLASSPGPLQARERHTLADGDPRPSRPLSTGKQ